MIRPGRLQCHRSSYHEIIKVTIDPEDINATELVIMETKATIGPGGLQCHRTSYHGTIKATIDPEGLQRHRSSCHGTTKATISPGDFNATEVLSWNNKGYHRPWGFQCH